VRDAFYSFHLRDKRFACLVAHRRAGKTVACVNELLTRALATSKLNARYAYLAPFYSQAKQIAWDYLKFYGRHVISKISESELKVTLYNGSTIRLYGADNPDSLRGIYLDGVVLDEYGDMKPSLWGAVIRPTLTDRKGWAVFIGTPKGKNHFYDIFDNARTDPEWFCLVLKASQTLLIDKDELFSAAKGMSEDQYEQEFECSFDAAIIGAFYSREFRAIEKQERIGNFPYNPKYPVQTAWDLGWSDDTVIWFFQVEKSGAVRVIDYYSASGWPPSHYAQVIHEKPYKYSDHWFPHDAEPKTFAAEGKSVLQQMYNLGVKGKRVPR